jgi:hypothetical protein
MTYRATNDVIAILGNRRGEGDNCDGLGGRMGHRSFVIACPVVLAIHNFSR